MMDIKFTGESNQVNNGAASPSAGSVQFFPSAVASIQMSANQQRDFEFSTSSTHNISDNGVYGELYEASYDNVSTSAILHYCKLKVLRPYFRLHSLLGWRPLIIQTTLFENDLWIKMINTIYTLTILTFIILGYVLQHASCYRQDGFEPYRDANGDDSSLPSLSAKLLALALNSSDKSNQEADSPLFVIKTKIGLDGVIDKNSLESLLTNATVEMQVLNKTVSVSGQNMRALGPQFGLSSDSGDNLKCNGNFFAMYLIPNILHLFAYLFVLYLMRTPESEKLENLMERGFLQTSRTTGWFLAHRKLVNSLRSFLWICVGWLIVSLILHSTEVGFRLYNGDLHYTWLEAENSSKLVLVVLTIATLTWNDLICGAIVTSYAVHCQLNISYIVNLCASIRERRLELSEFYKRIEESRKFIQYLNSDQALGLSLLQINLGCKLLVAVYGLLVGSQYGTWTARTLAVVMLSIFSWLSLFTVPLVQAVRLTSACRELQKIGHELRSRPFGYQEAQQSELDSLLLYTTTLSMEAKILHIPIRSSCLVVVCVTLLVTVLMLGQLGFLNV
ncbi:hypothetical protein HDE_08772 [Halotydeus destructor]|nr:hypothetical protein HDE_08772 [Halotydeus destructor]